MEKYRKPGQNGKGDMPRPFSIKREKYHENWEKIFGKSKNKDNQK